MDISKIHIYLPEQLQNNADTMFILSSIHSGFFFFKLPPILFSFSNLNLLLGNIFTCFKIQKLQKYRVPFPCSLTQFYFLRQYMLSISCWSLQTYSVHIKTMLYIFFSSPHHHPHHLKKKTPLKIKTFLIVHTTRCSVPGFFP